MRHAANFNPEWGYLAPRAGFLRSARLVVVASAIGATAGAAVAVSLVERPVAEESVAARTLVPQSVAVNVPPAASMSAAVPLPGAGQHIQPLMDRPGGASRQAALPSPAHIGTAASSASDAGTASTALRPAAGAALAEAPPMTDAPPVLVANQTVAVAAAPAIVPVQRAPIRKQKPASYRAAARYVAPRYYYDAQRYGQQYAQIGLGWQRPFGERAY
jgi:hypothetical protein